MAVGAERWPAADYTMLFKGLPRDACVAEHSGHVVAGPTVIRYADGDDDEIGVGDVYHAPSGHTFEVLEPIDVVEFSPVDAEYEQTMAAFGRNLPVLLEALTA